MHDSATEVLIFFSRFQDTVFISSVHIIPWYGEEPSWKKAPPLSVWGTDFWFYPFTETVLR